LHERKRPIGGSRREWAGNIKMNLEEIWREGVEWIYLARTPVKTIIKIQMQLRAGKCFGS
jgi:hypothetical protein